MGCRALVIVHDGEGNYGPTLYTHWGGEEIEERIERLKQQMGTRVDDVEYASARMVEIMCSGNPGGNSGVGIWNSPRDLKDYTPEQWKKYSHGDSGIFLIDVRDYSFTKPA